MKIQFDIKYRPQIESGEYKVELRDGTPVKIIYWEAKGPAPIIGLFTADDGTETTTQAYPNGKWSEDASYESHYDLFVIITPEEELTDFENAFVRAMMEVPEPEEKEEWYQFLKEKSAELLDLARVALVDEQTKREDLSFSRGLRQGREEAKKSPWIPASNPPEDNRLIFLCNNIGGVSTCVGTGHYLFNGMWVDSDDRLTYPDYWMEIPELPKEEITMATKRIVRGVDAEVKYHQLSPLLSEELHWDRFRMLASAMAMAGFIAREEQPLYPGTKETNCSRAIEWADELIRQLKEE